MEAFAGRYRLIDLIGTGGMGSVWRAWDLRRSAYVAAKVLGQHDAVTLLRFVREQSLRIEHPHLVAPHGWAADDEKVVFAMDLVRGGSVATLLGDHGPLPPSYVAVLLDQLLHGLSAVHAAGVVHRDVKPANLLLDVTGKGRPHLRLSDFGVAGLLDEPRMTRHSTVLGTPGYLAPDQLAGADPDPRQDLYAVGAVAAELLTGERPGTTASFRPSTVRSPTSSAGVRRLIRTTAPTPRPPPAAYSPPPAHSHRPAPLPGPPTPTHPKSSTNSPPLPREWTPTGPAPHQTPSRLATPRPTRPATEAAQPAPAVHTKPVSAAHTSPAPAAHTSPALAAHTSPALAAHTSPAPAAQASPASASQGSTCLRRAGITCLRRTGITHLWRGVGGGSRRAGGTRFRGAGNTHPRRGGGNPIRGRGSIRLWRTGTCVPSTLGTVRRAGGTRGWRGCGVG